MSSLLPTHVWLSPSKVAVCGLHWQKRLEKCTRTLSLSWVSPISGKAFKKFLSHTSAKPQGQQEVECFPETHYWKIHYLRHFGPKIECVLDKSWQFYWKCFTQRKRDVFLNMAQYLCSLYCSILCNRGLSHGFLCMFESVARLNSTHIDLNV